MNAAEVNKLMSQLRFAIKPRHRRIKNPDGPDGRLMKMRKTVTALLSYERIELNYNRADEARGYAERLISYAIRNGASHKPTMEMADYWLLDKSAVHKLFKVIVPRFEESTLSYTRMYRAPREYPCTDFSKRYRARSVLELRGNPYPSLVPDQANNSNFINNVLLDAAKAAFHKEKIVKAAEAIGKKENPKTEI